jgi:16S rRNA (adenine1518-N6/adenine1519-N6)-dimethyltransferase
VSDDGWDERPKAQSHKAASALRELGRGANRRFGQNFLTQPAYIERIADLAEITPGAPTLEIGPGLGVLTEALLRRGAALQVVEIDRELAARLQERLPELPLLVADATTLDWSEVCPGEGWTSCANLPYNVATPILAALLDEGERFRRHVLMFQLEVAQRLAAKPGDDAYGGLSLLCQAAADVRIVLELPPGAFHPPPKIWSAVVRLDPHPTPRTGGLPMEGFRRAVRAGFSQRRKTLLNALTATYGREQAGVALRATVGERRRAEELDHAAWEALAVALERP